MKNKILMLALGLGLGTAAQAATVQDDVQLSGTASATCGALSVTDHLDYANYVAGAANASDNFTFEVNCDAGTLVDITLSPNNGAVADDHMIGTELDGVTDLDGAVMIEQANLHPTATGDVFSSDTPAEAQPLVVDFEATGGADQFTVPALLTAGKTASAVNPRNGTLSKANIFTVIAEF